MTKKRDPKPDKAAERERPDRHKAREKGAAQADLSDQTALRLDAAPFDWSVKDTHHNTDDVNYIQQAGPVPIDARTLLAVHKVLMLANKAHELDDYLKKNRTYVAASPDLVNTLKARIAKTNPKKLDTSKNLAVRRVSWCDGVVGL